MLNPGDVLGVACDAEWERRAYALDGQVVFHLIFQFEDQIPAFRMAVQ